MRYQVVASSAAADGPAERPAISLGGIVGRLPRLIRACRVYQGDDEATLIRAEVVDPNGLGRVTPTLERSTPTGRDQDGVLLRSRQRAVLQWTAPFPRWTPRET